jgi:hypothetical protein
MTQDEIIEMARQADAKYYGTGEEGVTALMLKDEAIEAFAKLVAAKEREACADIAENWYSNGFPRVGVAAQIRARGEA